MISVCMATYNGEKFIKKQIDSILCQLNIDDELIISDDSSEDGTIDIINSYQDDRIKLLVHTRNTELIHKRCSGFRFSADNFANSLSYAHGDFIFLSDQDDIWNKDKIKIMTEQLKYFDLVMCNYSIIDNNDTLQRRDILKKNPVSKMFIKNLYNTPFLGCTMAFSRKALSYCLPFPRGVIGHDFWIGCIVCIKGTYKYIDKALHLYRRHDLNVSSGGLSRSKNSFAFKILYRFVFIMQIIVRLLESSCAKGISNDYIFY